MRRAVAAAFVAVAVVVVVVVTGAACATEAAASASTNSSSPAPATAAPADPLTWRAAVRVLDDGSRLAVTLCFDGPRPRRLVAEEAVLVSAARHLRWTRGAAEGPLTGAGRVVSLEAAPEDACVAWDVDLDDTSALLRSAQTSTRVGAHVVATPDVWLFHAEPAGTGRLVFEVAPPLRVVAPWPRDDDGAYVVDASTFRFRTLTAFGPLRPFSLSVSGAVFDVVVLDGPPMRASQKGIERWLTKAAGAVATIGRFPVDHVTIVVMPVEGRPGSSVAFGEVLRGGGPCVYLMASAGASDDALLGEWVAVHELSHLVLPPVLPADAWLYEGIASYYQNVLRGRAGLLDEAAAWQQLHDGFERGRGAFAFGTLQDASAQLGTTFAFQRVYWGGAAFALALDVALRRESAGKTTLDDALAAVRARLPANARTTAAVVLAMIEEMTGSHAPQRLYAEIVQQERFPALDDVYGELGIRIDGGRVVLDDGAPGAAHRRAIAAPVSSSFGAGPTSSARPSAARP